MAVLPFSRRSVHDAGVHGRLRGVSARVIIIIIVARATVTKIRCIMLLTACVVRQWRASIFKRVVGALAREQTLANLPVRRSRAAAARWSRRHGRCARQHADKEDPGESVTRAAAPRVWSVGSAAVDDTLRLRVRSSSSSEGRRRKRKNVNFSHFTDYCRNRGK